MTHWLEVADLPADHASDSIRSVVDACRRIHATFRLWVAGNSGAALCCETDVLFEIGMADDLLLDTISQSTPTVVMIIDAPDISDMSFPESEEARVDWVGLTYSTTQPAGLGKEAMGLLTVPPDTKYSVYARHFMAPDASAMFKDAPTKLGERPGHLGGRAKWFKKR